MRIRFVPWDILFVMFGSFAVAYGLAYTLREKESGMTVVLLGISILSFWVFLILRRPNG